MRPSEQQIRRQDEFLLARRGLPGVLIHPIRREHEQPTCHGRDGQVEQDYFYLGPCGAGSFEKMMYSNFDYGLIQVYAEGITVKIRVHHHSFLSIITS